MLDFKNSINLSMTSGLRPKPKSTFLFGWLAERGTSSRSFVVDFVMSVFSGASKDISTLGHFDSSPPKSLSSRSYGSVLVLVDGTGCNNCYLGVVLAQLCPVSINN